MPDFETECVEQDWLDPTWDDGGKTAKMNSVEKCFAAGADTATIENCGHWGFKARCRGNLPFDWSRPYSDEAAREAGYPNRDAAALASCKSKNWLDLTENSWADKGNWYFSWKCKNKNCKSNQFYWDKDCRSNNLNAIRERCNAADLKSDDQCKDWCIKPENSDECETSLTKLCSVTIQDEKCAQFKYSNSTKYEQLLRRYCNENDTNAKSTACREWCVASNTSCVRLNTLNDCTKYKISDSECNIQKVGEVKALCQRHNIEQELGTRAGWACSEESVKLFKEECNTYNIPIDFCDPMLLADTKANELNKQLAKQSIDVSQQQFEYTQNALTSVLGMSNYTPQPTTKATTKATTKPEESEDNTMMIIIIVTIIILSLSSSIGIYFFS